MDIERLMAIQARKHHQQHFDLFSNYTIQSSEAVIKYTI